MSKERGIRKRGNGYEVRWREGNRHRSRQFSRIGDARSWRDEIRRRRDLSGLGLVTASDATLTEFTADWLRVKLPDLSENTIRGYDYLINRFILPYLGDMKLAELRPRVIETWKQDRLAEGAGRRSLQQALALLSSICRSAVAQEMMLTNPCDAIDGPRRKRKSVIPLSPLEVERLREHMIQNGHLGAATLVSVLAYAGLRPSEAYGLFWQDVTDGTITVTKKVVEGRVVSHTKTEVPRAVTVRGPLTGDLQEWFLARAEPDPDELVFPRVDGRAMTRTDIGNFRRRIFIPARKAIGRNDATPYHLRHSFASMLIAEGDLSPAEIAAECGHDIQTLFRNYTHIVQGAKRGKELSFAEQIRAARAKVEGAAYTQQEVKNGP